MTTRFVLLLLAAAAFGIVGCSAGTPGTPSTTAPIPSINGNWQIQPSAYPVTPTGTLSSGLVLLIGDLESSGSQVSGTFRYSNLAHGVDCALAQVIQVTGTVDAASHLTLSSAKLSDGSVVVVSLDPSTNPANTWKGTIAVSGGSCVVASESALGVNFPAVTGTYTGTLSIGLPGQPSTVAAGTASLTVTQSSTPTADGHFPLSGTFAYSIGTCTGSVAMSGSVNGVLVSLASTSTTVPLSIPTTLLGGINFAATQVITPLIRIQQAPCSGEYTGSLDRQ